MKARFIIALLAVATLCASAIAQENTAEDWYKKGLELSKKGSHELLEDFIYPHFPSADRPAKKHGENTFYASSELFELRNSLKDFNTKVVPLHI